MKKLLTFLVLSLIVLQANVNSVETEKSKIIELVKKAYLGGVFNDSTTDAMKEGFHKDFTLQMPVENQIKVMKLTEWEQNLSNWKDRRENWNNRAKADIEVIGFQGTAAIVQTKVYIDENLVYTDFLSLYKFSDGWKITNKIYYEHK